MEAAVSRTSTLCIWIPRTIAVLLSIASALSYFGYMGQGIVVGDMIGLPGREAHVALAQGRATYWLMACLLCLATSIVTGTVALPFPFYPDASRLSRLMARLVLASILSLALTVFIAVVAFSIITSLHPHVLH